jgi:transcriptional/translational regulatory protein YebC/TACO1
MDPDEFQLEIIDAGVEDFEVEDEVFVITTAMEDFGPVQKKLESMGVTPENATLSRIPNNMKTLEPEAAMKVLKMIDEFEDDDDVQNVYHNLELTEEIEAAMDN